MGQSVLMSFLGIETAGGVLTRIIKKGTPIPTVASADLTTLNNNQDSVLIRIYKGDSRIANKNVNLKLFHCKKKKKTLQSTVISTLPYFTVYHFHPRLSLAVCEEKSAK